MAAILLIIGAVVFFDDKKRKRDLVISSLEKARKAKAEKKELETLRMQEEDLQESITNELKILEPNQNGGTQEKITG